ncbi:MAG TPA: BTAD domain-containing putative transcriptional regulator [Streptosporangiaceae bacterium]
MTDAGTGPSPTTTIAVLGTVGVERRGSMVRPTSGITRGLLGVLAVAAPSGVAVATLRERVWGPRGGDLSESAVGVAVHRLRRWLRETAGDAVTVEHVHDRYVLRTPHAVTDVAAFRALTASASAADLPDRISALERGLGLWRGRPLEDLEPDVVDHGTIAQLVRERVTAAVEYARAVGAAGDPDRAVPVLAPLTEQYPMDEPLLGAWIETLASCGRQAEALDAYDRLRRRLDDQLGVTPGAELRDIHMRVLRQETAPRAHIPSPERRPRQVPTGVADFTGRDDHVATVLGLLSGDTSGGAVGVSTVAGMGGVGKSALVRHIAHRVRDDFPDGQLFADLQGAESAPAEPAEILGRFLRALGVGGSSIPDGPAERAALYRTVLSERRMLIVLDNAADEDQVLPLLPGGTAGTRDDGPGAGCRVIVTSRARLTALPGARIVELDVLDAGQARELLVRILGARRVTAEPGAAADLVRLCGGLPLALRIAGARLAAKPHWRITDLAARLRDRQRLDELAHHGLSVRATLDVSYDGLDAPAQRLYGLLGQLEAPDLPAWAPAALLGAPQIHADDVVESLVDARLVEAVRPADDEVRYVFHDLVREHARERGLTDVPPEERDAAVRRALGGWLSLADTVIHAVNRGGDALPAAGAVRYALDADTTARAAARPGHWLDHETIALTACVTQAASRDDVLCWELAVRSSMLFQPVHYVDAWRKVVDTALPVVRAAGNRQGEAAVLHRIVELACARRDYGTALAPVEEALRLFESVADGHGVGLALRQRAVIHRMAGRYPRALDDAKRSYDLLRTAGDAAGAAHALLVGGQVRAERGEAEAALDVFERARDIAHGAHDASVELQSVYGIGQAMLALGQADQARGLFDYVGHAATAAGSRLGGMYANHGLGCAYAALGQPDDAERALTAALGLAQERRDRLTHLRVLYALAALHHSVDDTTRARREAQQALRLAESLAVPLWTARCRLQLSELDDDPEAASALRHQAEAGLAELGVRPAPTDVRGM